MLALYGLHAENNIEPFSSFSSQNSETHVNSVELDSDFVAQLNNIRLGATSPSKFDFENINTHLHSSHRENLALLLIEDQNEPDFFARLQTLKSR